VRHSRQDRSVCHTHGNTSLPGRNPYTPARQARGILTQPSVRSREGRRNRAPPPRVRFNKDGKKINPQQAGKVAAGAAA